MKPFSILVIAALLFACNNNKPEQVVMDQQNIAPPIIDSTGIVNRLQELIITRGDYEDLHFKLVANSRYQIPEKMQYDSSFYFKENSLILTDKATGKSYSLSITAPCSGQAKIVIENVTNALQFAHPLFEISTPDCSDWWISEYIMFNKDSLQKIFEISDANPARLIRIGEYNLAGTVTRRDEIVADFQEYPITISLSDYSEKITKPDRQEIGFATVALEDIEGIKAGQYESVGRYTIQKGTNLVVDSIFRSTKQVRLKLNSSLIIICSFSEVNGKLQSNNAG